MRAFGDWTVEAEQRGPEPPPVRAAGPVEAMMKWLRVAAAAGLAVTVGACGSSPEGHPGALVPDHTVSIYVDNETTVSLRLFALEGGAEVPLGRIGALEQRRVTIPGRPAAVIQLMARPSVDLGLDRNHTSDPITIVPGQEITWRLHLSPGVTGPQLSTVWIGECSRSSGC